MKELAVTDALTGISNRYAFNQALNNEIYRSNRHNSVFSLLMLDLDHFKNINDTYGHDIGDSILKEMTEIVTSCLREEDFFSRIGGEEFMIILPQTDISSAFQIAERIRQLVESSSFNVDQTITLSIGVSIYHKGENAEDVTKRADIALYKAKNSGRNIVIIEDN
jgi:diguanylate cyclase (GGDEF)-like protein